MRTFSTSPSVFRIVLVGLLLAVVLIKPVLAFDCAFAGDLQQGTEQAPLTVVALGFAATGGEDCCPFQDCHDCCAHTTAVLASDRLPSFAHHGVTIPPPTATPFQPRPPLTVFRPPIAC